MGDIRAIPSKVELGGSLLVTPANRKKNESWMIGAGGRAQRDHPPGVAASK